MVGWRVSYLAAIEAGPGRGLPLCNSYRLSTASHRCSICHEGHCHILALRMLCQLGLTPAPPQQLHALKGMAQPPIDSLDLLQPNIQTSRHALPAGNSKDASGNAADEPTVSLDS